MDKLLDEREQYYRKYNKYPYSNDVDLVGAKRVDVHDQIKDLLRHGARGKAVDAFVAELREKAEIEFLEVE